MSDGVPPLPDVDTLFEQAACGLLLTRPDGLIRRVNGTLCRWLARDVGELVDRVLFQDLLTVGSRIFLQTHWTPLLQLQGSVAEVKLHLQVPGGAPIPIVVNAVRRDHGGAAFHEIALFQAHDRHAYERELLAARRRAEAALEAEQQLRRALADAQAEIERQRATAEDRARFAEQMMGIVSHDLRNPLAVIDMSAQALRRSHLTPAQVRAVERVSNSTRQGLRLIADLLDLTQARLGRGLTMAMTSLDVHQLVADALDDLRHAFPQASIVHARAVADGCNACVGNRDRLVQVLGNLVSNAVRHGRAGGPITVTSRSAGPRCSIAVHNEGEPLAAPLLATLFEPMVRGPGRDAVEGVGLGLFIVREIARAHGGRVSVDSGAGRGTTFEVEFAAAT